MTWRALTVAPDGTHHLRGDEAAYPARFDAVLAFHEPGLAPVAHDGRAWHIDDVGRDAYARRFERTFGFYEGLAAVVDESGWHHVLSDGRDAYAARHAWCGNFQGGRVVVRDDDGRYLHVLPGGAACYATRWRYAGDYRDGVAVVQGDDGRSTHIDRAGELVHGRWFDDLDVFHKGFARARDAHGWTHVDRQGRPRYAQRFAMVEPFYNGQARVERHDGAREVIDEDGRALLTLRSAREAVDGRDAARGAAPRSESELARTLAALDPERPFVLVVRHAAREPISDRDPYADVDLTPAGIDAARDLGDAVGAMIRWAATSPMRRCRRTVAEVLRGRAVRCDDDPRLGDPGAWVVDPREGARLYAALGTSGVVRRQIAGEAWACMRPLAEGSCLLLSCALDGLLRGDSGLCVSHDAVVMPAIAHLTGDRFESRWLAPLDGFAVQLGARGVEVVWRGSRFAVSTG